MDINSIIRHIYETCSEICSHIDVNVIIRYAVLYMGALIMYGFYLLYLLYKCHSKRNQQIHETNMMQARCSYNKEVFENVIDKIDKTAGLLIKEMDGTFTVSFKCHDFNMEVVYGDIKTKHDTDINGTDELNPIQPSSKNTEIKIDENIDVVREN